MDVGCGYGPIGLSLAYASQRPVEMIDINQRAVDLAQGNAKRNGIENADIHASNIYETLHQGEYAAILSNPPIRAGKEVVHEILTGALPLLKTGGTLTIVIQKKQGAPVPKRKCNKPLVMPKSSKRQRVLYYSKLQRISAQSRRFSRSQ